MEKSTIKTDSVVRPINRFRWLSAAAVVLLLVTAGYFLLAGEGGTEYNNTSDAPMAVALPDGTKVLLQEGSTLSYPVDYNDTERHVDLSGQAFFEVHKDKDRPFLVNTSETELRVTGTAFNLRINGEEMEVEVSEGSVELHRQGHITPVKARQCGIAVPGKKCTRMEATNLNRHAWRTGTLTFDSMPLSLALKTISNNFGLEIKVPTTCDFPLTGNFDGKNPIAVLETIAAMDGGNLKQLAVDRYQLSDMVCGK
ncbi:FecR family protein [Neolewinella persica]|uniref:FecR family protein n=1 Tax=Neolewinella persica TaxID=70998 RepID=UPI000693A930|nr:FecR domain-containing protein [Neolewinella persica]